MRNFENNYGGQTNSGNTGWELVGDNEELMADDDFEQHQAEREARRERVRSYEQAEAIMWKKALALAGSALATLALVGAILGGGCSTHGIMNTDHADKVETIHVRSFTLEDGPNIRTDPSVGYQDDNLIIDSGEEGQRMHIPYEGTVYYFNDQIDPNGGWYGFPAEEFANTLFENGYISRKEADELVKKEEEDDGVFWVNDRYGTPNEVEETDNIG